MKNNLIAPPIGILIFYISYYGSVHMYYDIIYFFLEDEVSRSTFIKSHMFADISAFVSFLPPAFLCAFLTSLIDMQRGTKTALYVSLFSIVALPLIIGQFVSFSNLRISDILAFVCAVPAAWLGVRSAYLLPNKSFNFAHGRHGPDAL